MNTHTDNYYEQVVSRLILESPQVKITSIATDMLLSDISVDSLEKLSIAMDLEEAYDIEISDDEVEQFESVADIVGYITLAVNARKEKPEIEAAGIEVTKSEAANPSEPREPLQENMSFDTDDVTGAIEAGEKAKRSNTA
ncbi:MAG: phosphopantetheine-binding protein [Pseudomonadales bacterium]